MLLSLSIYFIYKTVTSVQHGKYKEVEFWYCWEEGSDEESSTNSTQQGAAELGFSRAPVIWLDSWIKVKSCLIRSGKNIWNGQSEFWSLYSCSYIAFIKVTLCEMRKEVLEWVAGNQLCVLIFTFLPLDIHMYKSSLFYLSFELMNP